MSKALVSCPATDTTELIEFLDTPLGALVHACSRFRPATAMACGRACARGCRRDLEEVGAEFEIETEPDDTDIEIDAIPQELAGKTSAG